MTPSQPESNPVALRDATRQAKTLRNRLAHAEAARDRVELRIALLAKHIEAVQCVIRAESERF